MAIVRIEGVAFALDDAAEFARRLRRYSGGATQAGLSPAHGLAAQIEQRVEEGGDDLPLIGSERVAASAVLDEWRQVKARPEAVDVLYRLLARISETIEKIKAELFRLHARPEDVGADGIVAGDRGHGNAAIECRRGRNFYWFGSADEILERLSGMPAGEGKSGPEIVRSEFADGVG